MDYSFHTCKAPDNNQYRECCYPDINITHKEGYVNKIDICKEKNNHQASMNNGI